MDNRNSIIVKALITVFLVTAFGCSTESMSLTSDSHLTPEEKYWHDHDYDIRGRTLKIYPKQRKIKRIQGVCIIKGPNDLFDNYCNNIELFLEDQNQKIVASVRTEASGTFIFDNIEKGNFQLKVKDIRYRKVSEFIFVSPGSEVLIHLEKLKNGTGKR